MQSFHTGSLVVTANQRLARSIRREYDRQQAEAGRTAWAPARVLHWQAWLEALWFEAVVAGRLPASTRLSKDQSAALWRAILEQSGDPASILQPSAAASAAMSAWTTLAEHRLDWRRKQYPGHDDWVAFTGWAHRFERRLERENWLDPARLADVVRGGIGSGAIEVPAEIALAGFDEFTPQQQSVLDALEAAGCRRGTVPVVEHRPAVRRVEALDGEHELRLCARWCRDQLSRQPRARIGVVLPGRAERNRIERVFTEVMHPDWIPALKSGRALFHISFARPLAEWPIVHAAFLLLKLTRARLPLADASAILRSPYFGETEEAERARRDARLRRNRPADVSSAEVLKLDGAGGERPFSEWAAVIRRLLEQAGWAAAISFTSAEYQARLAWDALLERFSSLDLVSAPVVFDSAVARLREMAEATSFEPEDPDAPVQITGALEAAGASFDALWIAGLDDESWPATAHFQAFLPPALQIEHSLPHCSAARELEFARRTTARLLSSAPEVVVSSARGEGESAQRPSRIIAGFPLLEAAPSDDAFAALMARRGEMEWIDDHQGPALAEAQVTGGTRVLKAQAECPFRAFAEFRLGARPLEAPVLGVDPLERGGALHSALEAFWRQVGSHGELMAMASGDLEALVRRVARAAVKPDAQTGELDRRFRELEVERVENVLMEWVALEKEREPFEVVACELKREVTLGGLALSTRIDRVDRLASGKLVILDYKSKAPGSKAWEGERIEEPQLPLYAVTADDPLEAVAFAQLMPNDLKFRGIAGSEGILPNVKASRTPLKKTFGEWREALTATASEFREGEAAVDPLDSACKFCALPALCRIHEQKSEAGDG